MDTTLGTTTLGGGGGGGNNTRHNKGTAACAGASGASGAGTPDVARPIFWLSWREVVGCLSRLLALQPVASHPRLLGLALGWVCLVPLTGAPCSTGSAAAVVT